MRWPRLFGVCVLGVVSCGDCGDSSQPEHTTVRRITESSELIRGVEATGRIGDYLLDNGHVRFIVQQPGSSTGWGLFGGSLVDVDAVRAGDVPGNDLLEELFVQCDFRGFAPTTAEIVDGTTLRLIGADAGIPFLDAILARDPLEVTMTVDLTLPPDGRTLELRVRVKDERKTRARDIGCGFILLPGDAYTLSSPDKPFGESVGGKNGYLAASAPGATTSYVIHRPDGEPVNVIIDGLGILPIAPEPIPFLANATIEERYFISVGDSGDLDSALSEMRSVSADGEARRAVTLNTPTDVTVSRRTVHLIDGLGRAATSASVGTIVESGASKTPAENTTLHFRVPPGTYEAIVEFDDREVARFDVDIEDGDGEQVIDHPIRSLGMLRLSSFSVGLDGASEGPTPARLRVAEGHGGSAQSGVIYQAYVPEIVDVVLPEGPYTIIVSRGPEHELHIADVDVVSGQTSEVEARIVRVVDTSGWMSADLHVHGTRSADSEVSRRARVLGAAAEGVDVLVATDHDAVTDYAPTVEALGLQDRLQAVAGIEMSMLYGHMNGYPVNVSTPQDHWRPGWFVYDEAGRFERVREPHEVADTMRGEGAKVVQINHPRDGGGVFGYLGVDDMGGTTKQWPDVNAAELLNGKRIGDYEEVIVDLFRLLEAGHRITAVGSSDVHGDFGVGYARTYVRTTGDLDSLWTELSAGHVLASNGPFVDAQIRAQANVAGPGDTIVASGPIGIEVRIEAPTWMSVENLRLYENGVALIDRPLTVADADPNRPALRFMGTLTATPTADAYYLVEVRGGSSPPLLSETIATTNPMLVDADGDGWRYR